MTKTFSVLAALLTMAIVASIGVGFWSKFTEEPVWKSTIFLVHFNIGLGTALGILLVHCLIFMYFLGTGRWVKEVTIAYRMPDEPLHKTTRELKRKAFPPALFSMLIGIATAGAGAGAQQRLVGWHWSVHMTLAFLTLAINLWAFVIEYRCVRTNAWVLQAVLDEVDTIRRSMGLESNAEALAREEKTDIARIGRDG
jgi:hypothetical protein